MPAGPRAGCPCHARGGLTEAIYNERAASQRPPTTTGLQQGRRLVRSRVGGVLGGPGVDDGEEGFEVDGFGAVVIEAGLDGAEAVALLGVTGNGDKERLGEGRLRAQGADELVAIEARQTEIE